jgi:GT2 family glycosyltransferase
MKLSVIILNYNVRYFLELCLKSVEVAIQNIDAEIIVVDNNSPDDSCDMVKQLFPSVQLIENKENSGFSKGNNRGVTHAKGEYLCILNPDTVVTEDTLTKLISFADTKNNIGIVGCQLIDGTGKFLPESKRNIPKPKVALKKLIGDDKYYYASQLDIDAVGDVEILVGAFMFLKKEVYEVVGGFDEDYFMYGEDIDLSYKVLKAGYNNMYFGDTTIIHFKGESTLRDSNYAKRFYGAMQIFYKKHFEQNIIFNGMVWLGIKLASKRSSYSAKVKTNANRTYVYSVGIDDALKGQLPTPTKLLNKILDDVENDSMMVYDFNLLSVKHTIIDLKHKSKLKNIVFRFLPKNSKFIIGSDSATDRGEVIHF